MTVDRLVELVRDALRSREREPGPRVTERSARADLYGGARTIDVAPRTVPVL